MVMFHFYLDCFREVLVQLYIVQRELKRKARPKTTEEKRLRSERDRTARGRWSKYNTAPSLSGLRTKTSLSTSWTETSPLPWTAPVCQNLVWTNNHILVDSGWLTDESCYRVGLTNRANVEVVQKQKHEALVSTRVKLLCTPNQV